MKEKKSICDISGLLRREGEDDEDERASGFRSWRDHQCTHSPPYSADWADEPLHDQICTKKKKKMKNHNHTSRFGEFSFAQLTAFLAGTRTIEISGKNKKRKIERKKHTRTDHSQAQNEFKGKS